LIAGAGCFWSATWLKHRFNYDDSLDAFGVHGTGGIIGAILTGAFAYGPLSATASNPEGTVASVHQVVAQAEAVGVTVVWCVIMTTLILKVLDLVIGLRVSPEEELEGLDMVLHGERIN
ncbi:MAG: ammonia channel protein, partial [Gluconobacter cerinus]